MSMDPGSPPLSMRDQGMQALRAGELDKAIDLLTRAVIGNDSDADAKALLGIAFSSKGLHAQGKRALQAAVELQPNNANFRFNLGVVLKRAGDLPGAAQAFRETLQVSPDHAQAKAELTSLGPQPQPAGPRPLEPPGVPTYGAPPAAPPSYGAAPAAPPSYGSPPPSAHSQYGAPPSGSAHSAASPLNAPLPPPPTMNPSAIPPALGSAPPPPPATMAAPPGALGQVQCPNCGQFPPAGMLCAYCSHPLPPPSRQVAAFSPMMTPGPSYGTPLANLPPDMSNSEAFFRRFGAYLIDSMILSTVGGVVGGIFGAAAGAGPNPTPEQAAGSMGTLMGIVYGITFAYFIFMTALTGQTLGKMALGIRVVGEDGGNPGFGTVFLRETIGKLLSGCICSIGYLAVLWDGDQQAWHDKVAHTHVVRT